MGHVVCLFFAQIGVGSYVLGLLIPLGISAYLYYSKRRLQSHYEGLIKEVESKIEQEHRSKTRLAALEVRTTLPTTTEESTMQNDPGKKAALAGLPETEYQISVVHQNGMPQLQNPIIEQLIHKKDFLKRIKQELKSVSSSNNEVVAMRKVSQLSRLIDKEHKMEEDWAIFNRYFQQIHPNFQERLVRSFPKLSAKDIKLCCLLRLDLSTKEMAPLLNISIRGTEISRYRLRKKLALNPKSNLVEHIRKI